MDARPYVPAPGGTLSSRTREALLKLHAEHAGKTSSDLSARLGFAVKLEARSMSMGTGPSSSIEGALGSLFNIVPGQALGIAGMAPAMGRTLVDAALGASPRSDSGGEPTPVERRVAEGFLELFLSRVNALWETLGECAFSLVGSVVPDEKVAARAASETYLRTMFRVSLQGTESEVEVGLPLSFVKPLTTKLDVAPEKKAGLADDPKMHPTLKRKMEGVLVTVKAFLEVPDVSLREIAALEPGDVLHVGRLGAEAVLFAGPAPLYRGQVGVTNGHRAIRVLGVAKSERRTP